MAFEFDQARQKYSDTQIVDYLKSTGDYSNFDFEAARGKYDDTKIVDYLKSTSVTPTETVQPETVQPETEVSTPEPTRMDDFKQYKESIKHLKDSDPAQYDQLLRDYSRRDKKITYLRETVDNPLTATGAGIYATFAGSGKVFEDLTGIDMNSKESIAKVKTVSDKLSGDTKLVGDIAAGLATGGPSVISQAVQIGLQTLGEGKGYTEAGLNVALTAAIGGSVKLLYGILDKTPEKTHKELYDYLVDHFSLDEAKLNEQFVKWQEFRNVQDTTDNRIKALVDYLGDRGVNLKQSVTDSPTAVKNINKAITETKAEVDKLAEGDFNIQNFAQDLQSGFERVGNDYELVKTRLGDTPVDTKFQTEPWQALDEATEGEVQELRRLIGEDNANIYSSDLMEAIKVLNPLIDKTKGTTRYKWGEVKKAVEKQLEDVLGPEDFKDWQRVNENYAKMAQVRESKLGDLIQSSIGTTFKGSDKLTPEEVMRQLQTVKAGDDIFNNIVELVGTDNTTKLEKAIIDRVLKNRHGNDTWEIMAQNLNSKGFVTEEGKNLQHLVDVAKQVFRTDDVMNQVNASLGHEGASIATTPQGKILVELIQRLSRMVKKNIPFSETAKYLKNMDTLEEVLKSPTEVKKLSGIIENMNPGFIQEVQGDIKGNWADRLNEWLSMEGRSVSEAGGGPIPEGDIPSVGKYSGQDPLKFDYYKQLTPEPLSEKTQDMAGRYLQDFKNGYLGTAFQGLKKMPRENKQEIVNVLYSSRNESQHPVKGLVPNQHPNSIGYTGMTVNLKPSDFLRLAHDRVNLTVDEKIAKAKDFSINVLNEVIEGKKPRIGPSYLTADIDSNKKTIVIRAHEGRHRSSMIRYIFGDDVYIPTDFSSLTLDGISIRNKDLTSEMLDYKLISQEGNRLGRSLRDIMLGTSPLLYTLKEDTK